MSSDCEISIRSVTALAADVAFGKPLITNTHRGLIAEAMIAQALDNTWRWCSADYAAWDFERADGVKLEVKQAAARQTWHAADDAPSQISFDIRARTGRYDGATWITENRRWADLYVLAHHQIADNSADHRDPLQWVFYVVPEQQLPRQQTIGLARVRSLARSCLITDLGQSVQSVAASVCRSR